MRIKNEFFLTCIMLVALLSSMKAQEVLTTAGGSGATTGARVTWTVGEVATETVVGTTIALTQGFNQGDLIITMIREAEEKDLGISIFPNPASDRVNVTATAGMTDNLRYVLIDIYGRKLKEGNLALPESYFMVDELKPGIYFLIVYTGKMERGIYRIVKK